MDPGLLEMLQCPDCGSERLDSGAEGTVRCRQCETGFPVSSGILRMLPATLRNLAAGGPRRAGALDSATESKIREMNARDSQVRDYDAMWHLRAFGLLEVPATLRFLRPKKTDTLLEAGCGTGRMTSKFAVRCRRLVAMDYSFDSLLANKAKLEKRGVSNVTLVQADLCSLPFRDETFHRVVSCQVLEHVPGEAAREQAVEQLSRVLRQGGKLCLSAYQYGPFTRGFGPKEGEHAGGIYYFRFRREELRSLLSRAFRVERMTGALLYHYIAQCRKETLSVG